MPRDPESRRHMGASRSRWTFREGWVTPPEDKTPMSPRERQPDGLPSVLVVALIAMLAFVWALIVLANTAKP